MAFTPPRPRPRSRSSDIVHVCVMTKDDLAPPRIAQAPVHLECRRYVTLEPARERYLVIGEVLVVHVRDGLVDPATLRIDRDRYAPIGRLLGGGYVRTRDRFDLPRLTYREWLAQQSCG
jgi:flavin reductase (DIM6/NTAB) family NADH-FMN oxidoreductase RutF